MHYKSLLSFFDICPLMLIVLTGIVNFFVLNAGFFLKKRRSSCLLNSWFNVLLIVQFFFGHCSRKLFEFYNAKDGAGVQPSLQLSVGHLINTCLNKNFSHMFPSTRNWMKFINMKRSPCTWIISEVALEFIYLTVYSVHLKNDICSPKDERDIRT